MVNLETAEDVAGTAHWAVVSKHLYITLEVASGQKMFSLLQISISYLDIDPYMSADYTKGHGRKCCKSAQTSVSCFDMSVGCRRCREDRSCIRMS